MSNVIALFIGPSGSGKTTIVEELEKRYGLKSLPSYTTRPQRRENENGHSFVSKADFQCLQNLVAYTTFDSYEYGATAEQIEAYDTYVIDFAGAQYFAKAYKGNKQPIVFYITVPRTERKKRMLKRGDGGLAAARRLKHDDEVFNDVLPQLRELYSNVNIIFNDDLDRATEKIYSIIERNDGV